MHSYYDVTSTTHTVEIFGATHQSVNLDAEGFFKTLLTLPAYRKLDFLRIATAIYAIDRISKRKQKCESNRTFQITFAVYDLNFWKSEGIKSSIEEILYFLTHDVWDLKFRETDRSNLDSGHQDFLHLSDDFSPKRIALYSGGLDSAAGLANRLLAGENNYLLLTVKHQAQVHSITKNQITSISKLIQNRLGVRSKILHSTLKVSLKSAKRVSSQELTQRSRAFLFCTTAAIAADAFNLTEIEIFENGVGAINLPLMSGMLDGRYATRGAHPTFLKLMSELTSSVMEKNIAFVLPFKWQTKAEMVRNLRDVNGLAEWAQKSKSCVHGLRKKGKTHCGCCPACIERRQAFTAAGVVESLAGYDIDVLNEAITKKEDRDYLHLSQMEALKWEAGTQSSMRRMETHLCLTGVPLADYDKIRNLQLRHSREIIQTFSTEFCRNDTRAPTN